MDFYQTIATQYDSIFPLQQSQLHFVEDALNPAATVVDLGCATASLAIALARKGYSVTGIDLSMDLLHIAKEKISAAGSRATVRYADMRNTSEHFQPDSTDAVLCFGNTLSHLPPSDLPNLLQDIYRLLKRGGTFMAQIVNYDRLCQLGIADLPTIETDAIRFVRTYHQFDGRQKFTFRGELHEKNTGKTLTATEILHPLSQNQLEQLLAAAGFAHIDFFGSFNKDAVSLDTIPLVVRAQKLPG